MFDFMMDDFGNGGDYVAPTGPNVPDKMDCMRCGMCLSQCPTYTLTQDEQEGPRQRIRTLSALVMESETPEPEAIAHLNNCLQCRACEAVCPSQMDYSELFDKAQQQLSDTATPGFYAKLALKLVADKTQLRRLLPAVTLYHLSGARWLAQNVGLLKILGLDIADSMARLPVTKPLLPEYAAKTKAKGKVALFSGCISEAFDRETLDSAIKVLTVLGYEVTVPEQQTCCGAIHYHNGEADTAKQLMQQNRNCFNELDVDALIFCVTGCGSQLKEYEKALELTDEKAFKPELYEITEFLAKFWDDSVTFKPSFRNVAVHEPCSQRNVLKSQQSVYAMLGKVPGLKVQPLADNHLCCGAGGSYMLTHPQTAQTLRDMKWNHIRNAEVNCVVTSNIGCALHLETAKHAATSTYLIHPISLLAQQLPE